MLEGCEQRYGTSTTFDEDPFQIGWCIPFAAAVAGARRQRKCRYAIKDGYNRSNSQLRAQNKQYTSLDFLNTLV